jgi:hypothetical protein
MAIHATGERYDGVGTTHSVDDVKAMPVMTALKTRKL